MVEYRHLFEIYVLDCEYKSLSSQTIAGRRATFNLFAAWVDRGNDLSQIKGFFLEGRKRGVHPNTERTNYARLKSFFDFLVAENYLPTSPLASVTPPAPKVIPIQPFSEKEIEVLMRVSVNSKYHSLMMFLLDTGVRVTELCNISCSDVDLRERRCKVRGGKGNKDRYVYFGARVGRMIAHRILKASDPSSPLFTSPSGSKMLRGTITDRLRYFGQKAGIKGVRVSPHTFRHTFAIMFLRNGGNVFTLKELLGHTDLKMTMRYVAVAQTDMAEQHKKYSPADNLKRR